jgi:hypothetical protein
VGLESCTRNSKNTFVNRSRITKWIKAFGITMVALGISSHTNSSNFHNFAAIFGYIRDTYENRAQEYKSYQLR